MLWKGALPLFCENYETKVVVSGLYSYSNTIFFLSVVCLSRLVCGGNTCFSPILRTHGPFQDHTNCILA